MVLYAALIATNIAVWAWTMTIFQDFPVLLGTALLAYTFGLRHAMDADHIAAIDNATRKLMHDGQRPLGVGLYFALGHSTVVMLASAAIALTASAIETHFAQWRQIGGAVGTTVSAGFLFAIAAANVTVLVAVYRTFRRVRNGGDYVEEDLDLLLARRGLLSRLFRPVFRLVRKSWHLYPLGLLFGLGFDTATEIGVLGMSGASVANGLPVWTIMAFPALFTAGMCLVDTTDSVLMLGAYNWAFLKPIRKLYYNLTITTVSVMIAVVVGGIELLGVIGDQLGLDRGFWRVVANLNSHFGSLGFVIAGLFIASWIVSVTIYRIKGYDRVEVAGM